MLNGVFFNILVCNCRHHTDQTVEKQPGDKVAKSPLCLDRISQQDLRNILGAKKFTLSEESQQTIRSSPTESVKSPRPLRSSGSQKTIASPRSSRSSGSLRPMASPASMRFSGSLRSSGSMRSSGLQRSVGSPKSPVSSVQSLRSSRLSPRLNQSPRSLRSPRSSGSHISSPRTPRSTQRSVSSQRLSESCGSKRGSSGSREILSTSESDPGKSHLPVQGSKHLLRNKSPRNRSPIVMVITDDEEEIKVRRKPRRRNRILDSPSSYHTCAGSSQQLDPEVASDWDEFTSCFSSPAHQTALHALGSTQPAKDKGNFIIGTRISRYIFASVLYFTIFMQIKITVLSNNRTSLPKFAVIYFTEELVADSNTESELDDSLCLSAPSLIIPSSYSQDKVGIYLTFIIWLLDPNHVTR